MKCEKCGNNAVYYYRETINGKTTERHLCAECAEKEGLNRAFEEKSRSLFGGFDEMMDSFFPRENDFLFPGMSRLARAVMAPAFAIPRIEIGYAPEKTVTQTTEPAVKNVPETTAEPVASEEGRELRRQRELNALRRELQSVVAAENYERAIELRDKIREMEK